MASSDPRLAALRERAEEGRPSMAQKASVPVWMVSVLIALISGGLSSAVTYGATISRVSTIERDVAAALVRIDRSEGARVETERTLAVLVTRLDAIATSQREQGTDLRAMRASMEEVRETLARRR